MQEIEGKYTGAKIYSLNIDKEVVEQTLAVCNHPIFKDCKVRIMPDCHKGKGCTIGFSSQMPKGGEVIPNIIGVDQSCGMYVLKLGAMEEFQGLEFGINNEIFAKLDKFIRNNIPAGIRGRDSISSLIPKDLISQIEKISKDYLKEDSYDDLLKIGSLGGGNHFIELAKSDNNDIYLIIHSGSRNFGNKLANHFQKIAIEKNCYGDNNLKELSYLDKNDAKDYLYCADVCRQYAHWNRKIIADEITKAMNWQIDESFETVHNYIGEDNIIRKGAISAKENEKVLIPLNMADGSLICLGKGNPDWNNTAPHGAGRILTRTKAKEVLSIEEYKKRMKNVYSTSVSKGTIDESPMAYKKADEIIEAIQDSILILDCIKPLYNFKKS